MKIRGLAPLSFFSNTERKPNAMKTHVNVGLVGLALLVSSVGIAAPQG